MTVSLSRLLLSRLSIWLLLTAAGGYFLYHMNDFIKFGIDLVGGTYITLEVQLDKARETELVERMQESIDLLKEKKNIQPVAKAMKDETVFLTFDDVKNASTAGELLAVELKGVTVNSSDKTVTLRLTADAIKRVNHDALESNILAINTRINRFGLGETSVMSRGDKRIIVELPNVHNLQQAKSMIGRSATLEIKPVEDSAGTEQDLLARYGGKLPEGTVIIPGKERGQNLFYLVPQFAEVTGRQLKTAGTSVIQDRGLEHVVTFEFKPEGARKFGELTRKNLGRRLAIILEGTVISAPTVQSEISRSGQITGDFTAQSSLELATLLRSGAFVAPVTFEEERHIGATLGDASIHQGLLACAVAFGILLLFCLFIYKVAGIFAFIILMYNLLLSLVILAGLGATLTLPGIAGLILTVGIAVDASILIYERIKEELAHGVPLRKAIDTGFTGALPVIIDSNVTAFLIALVLYWLGSGPIRGFAAAQIVGIIATLITGLWLLRSVLTFVTDVLGVNKIRF